MRGCRAIGLRVRDQPRSGSRVSGRVGLAVGFGFRVTGSKEFQAIAVEGANYVSVLSEAHDKIIRWMNT